MAWQWSKECTYLSGKLNGSYQSWHDNGQKWEEGSYLNGELNGSYTTWYNNGEICESK